MDEQNITFDFTVDEAVDVQLKYVRSTSEGASWRRREQWMFAIPLTFVMATVLIFVNPDETLLVKSLLVAAAAAIALILVVPFGWYYDHLVTARMRRLLVEQLGGEGPYSCTVEVLPDRLSVVQNGIQLSFPWSNARSIDDGVDGIMITFRGGWVLVRSRGFTSAEHRAAFLRYAQQRLPGEVST